MALQRTDVTTEEFERFIALPENTERRFELVNGEVIKKRLPKSTPLSRTGRAWSGSSTLRRGK